jgi:hypothetical protein
MLGTGWNVADIASGQLRRQATRALT